MNELKKRRLELGLTLADVAAACREVDPRIDVPMVSRFESGVCLPTEAVRKCIFCTLQIAETDEYAEDGCLSILRENPLKTPPAWIEAFCDHIPHGKANAVSRQTLCNKTGQSDRAVRRMISTARKFGYVIINDGDGSGYYQSDDIREIEKAYHRETRRAMTILVARKVLRHRLKEEGIQV